LTLRVNQSLAKTAAGVNYPSARLPRLIQIVAPFSSRLSRDTRAAERDPQGVGARPHCLHGSPEVCGDVDDRGIGDDELPKSLILA
jgi:hypothetical protein